MADPTHATRWLDTQQQRVWRAYLLGTTRLTARLDRDLSARHGVSLPEYEILVRLSEAPDRRMRMAELADSLNHSRSRLTHSVARMETESLVSRGSCEEDRRGVYAALTEAGYDLLVSAAPTHVEGVRRYLVDAVSPEDFAAVGRVFTAVVDSVDDDRAGFSRGSACGR
ncbi:MAG: MarR family transcriptional regulator [Actinomycetota bacterium]|jgi:DNA-binding MarR family transcriptional regulator|nr:MarR family transcriptional regulator [Actinomycetota bacterium]